MEKKSIDVFSFFSHPHSDMLLPALYPCYFFFSYFFSICIVESITDTFPPLHWPPPPCSHYAYYLFATFLVACFELVSTMYIKKFRTFDEYEMSSIRILVCCNVKQISGILNPQVLRQDFLR